jgi:CarD family transcriptional regulator
LSTKNKSKNVTSSQQSNLSKLKTSAQKPAARATAAVKSVATAASKLEARVKLVAKRKVVLVKGGASSKSNLEAPKLVETKPIVAKYSSDNGHVQPGGYTEPVKRTGPIEVFRAGDKIVYPGHGVGEVDELKKTVIGGQEHQFYAIKIIDTGMKVMVPVSQAGAVGLRRIVDKRAVDKVYDILRDRNFKIDTQTWNRRYREYSQKIKTGSVYEIAMVLRDLSVLGNDKELSFGEKKMKDMAEGLLVSELALAKARPADRIVTELRELFA